MKKDTSKTILTISTGFLLFYLGFGWRWAGLISLAVGLIGIISPYLSKKIEWVWMKIADLLGMIFPKIALALVFFLVLFPISLLYKIFNKDPLMLSDKYDSYFINVERKIDKKSFENTW